MFLTFFECMALMSSGASAPVAVRMESAPVQNQLIKTRISLLTFLEWMALKSSVASAPVAVKVRT